MQNKLSVVFKRKFLTCKLFQDSNFVISFKNKLQILKQKNLHKYDLIHYFPLLCFSDCEQTLTDASKSKKEKAKQILPNGFESHLLCAGSSVLNQGIQIFFFTLVCPNINVWHKFDLLSTPQSRLRNLRVT